MRIVAEFIPIILRNNPTPISVMMSQSLSLHGIEGRIANFGPFGWAIGRSIWRLFAVLSITILHVDFDLTFLEILAFIFISLMIFL